MVLCSLSFTSLTYLLMNRDLKLLAEAIGHTHTKKLVQGHIKGLAMNSKSGHLTIYLDNAGPLHELTSKDGDNYLRKGLEKVYDTSITYELKLLKPKGSSRERGIAHGIHK
jgi:hypothetical protein